MDSLAWAHLPGCLYPERPQPRTSAFDEWVRGRLGPAFLAARNGTGRLRALATAADAMESAMRGLDDAVLRADLRRAARAAWAGSGEVARVLALVREAARRSLAVCPFETQLMGAAALLSGRLAEMQTGEGKTLTAGITAAIAACADVPVHVITVNDYLAERDVEEMRPLFEFLGLTSGRIVTGMERQERQASYACDIAYCTGKELVFDYLKDKAALGVHANQAQLRLRRLLGNEGATTLLRGLHFGIVDEADSVMIDEARTPLILSENAGPPGDLPLLREAMEIAATLREGEHFALHPGRREVRLLPAGRTALEAACIPLGREWTVRRAREHWILQALRARFLFSRDVHYVVKDAKVLIVDENTGRVLPGRTWEQGLHQMVETKEGCEPSDQARTVARITYQRFFRRYLRLAGMTGTAREVRGELWRVYHLPTTIIPTHRPCIRKLHDTTCVRNEGEKWKRVAERVAEMSSSGRPVLVGTRSVESSERLSAVLRDRGIEHRVLNALQDADEAALVQQAGEPGRVTVATNMAGRGTDIKPPEAVKACGGLHVILSEYHESRRIDRQLFGRAARQGDPGSAEAIVSLDDQLFRFHGGMLTGYLGRLFRSSPLVPQSAVEILRRRAQRRVEFLNARTREEATKHDAKLESMLSFFGKH